MHEHVIVADPAALENYGYLLEAGVTRAQIDEMSIDNPRRFFAPAG